MYWVIERPKTSQWNLACKCAVTSSQWYSSQRYFKSSSVKGCRSPSLSVIWRRMMKFLQLHHISLFEHKLSVWTTCNNNSKRGLTGIKASAMFTTISFKSKICLAWLKPSPIGSLASIYEIAWLISSFKCSSSDVKYSDSCRSSMPDIYWIWLNREDCCDSFSYRKDGLR